MLEGIIENLNLVYVEVDGASYDKILGLFKNGVMFEPSTPREFFYLASYCEHVMDNKDVAFRNYCRSAELGETLAMCKLARFRESKKDYDAAEIYYKKAFELGERYAMIGLAFLYKDIKKDYDMAEKYYKRAIAVGDTNAMNLLAGMYRDIKKDCGQAEFYYKMSAKLGDVTGMHNLAWLYEHGENDYDQAELYYKKAAELGNRMSLWNLCVLYCDKKKNYTLAEFYLKQIVQNDGPDIWPDAINMLFEIYADTSRFEEGFLLAHQYQDVISSKNMINMLNELKHPISKQNQEKVYAILEKLKLPPDVTFNAHVFSIMQDVGYWRQELFCRIVYHLKNKNDMTNVGDNTSLSK